VPSSQATSLIVAVARAVWPGAPAAVTTITITTPSVRRRCINMREL